MNFLKSKKPWLIALGAILSLGAIGGGVVGGFWNQINNTSTIVASNSSTMSVVSVNESNPDDKPSLSTKVLNSDEFSYTNALKVTHVLNTGDVATEEEVVSVPAKTQYTGDPKNVQDGSLTLGQVEFVLTEEEKDAFKTILKVTEFSENDNLLFKSGWVPVSQNVWRLRKAINNPVVSAMYKNNKDRYLSIDNYQWDRSHLEVRNLDFKGWTKTWNGIVEMQIRDNEKIPARNISYTKDDTTHKGLVVEIGKEVKTLELVNKHLQNHSEIKILVLENVAIDSEDLKTAIDQIPDSIEKLTLFWNESTAHALRNLYQKDKIKELELNSTKLKAINPYSIPKNAFVPRDYGVSPRIETFDFSGDTELTIEKLMEQLTFAKSKEATLRIFQGYFGGSGGYVAKLNLKNTKIQETDLEKLKTLDSNRGYRWIVLNEKTVEYFNVTFPEEGNETRN